MKLRALLITLPLLLATAGVSHAQIGVGIELPGVDIGINMPYYPQLVPVPGYPVYYAPRANSNYFFYDGLYWVYRGDNWYSSSWYNGPWQMTGADYVPLFVLRVPVRYYRQPPMFFRGWRGDMAPHWGTHWGPDWQQRRSGWDHWDHRQARAAAPLPVYQRQFSGANYPRSAQQQQALRATNYPHRSQEVLTQQHLDQREHQHAAPAPLQPGMANEHQRGQEHQEHSQPQSQPQQQPQQQQHSQPQPVAVQRNEAHENPRAERPEPEAMPRQERAAQHENQRAERPDPQGMQRQERGGSHEKEHENRNDEHRQ